MIQMFRTLIIDDERPARLRMNELLRGHSELVQIVGEAKNGTEAMALIEQVKPDLIFLDIQMPDMNGFTLLAQLEHVPNVIFTTAYEQFAIQAFEENAIDYLLKPIEENRFQKSMEKLKKLRATAQNPDFIALKRLFDQLQPKKELTAIPIKTKDKIFLVRLSEVVYFEAQQGYVMIHKANGDQHLTEFTLTQLEEKLPASFLRVQKSTIINSEKIGEINKYFNNRLVIIMQDIKKSRITSGTTYINQIRAALHLK